MTFEGQGIPSTIRDAFVAVYTDAHALRGGFGRGGIRSRLGTCRTVEAPTR